MNLTIYLCACAILALFTTALPTAKGVEIPDGDDKVVYTWSLPEKRQAERLDADEKVVYTWSLPEETEKV